MKAIKAVDLFCGAGGTSTGLAKACESIGATLHLTAVNHWDVAIKTHSANHPWAQHLCQSLDAVSPRKVVPSGHLHLMVASPECTHHSVARGGRPMSDQSRASAWHVLRWAEALRINSLLIENVREFRDWGPLGGNGRPLKSKKGQTYLAFLRALESLGYTVDAKVLNAANFGDPTTRERLFIMARRGTRRLRWPDPSHAPDGGLPFGQQKWRAAREVIDWSISGRSIFDRERPLAPATLARIKAGLRKFGGPHAEPFIVVLRRHADARSIDMPLPTVTAGGLHMGLCEPFVVNMNGRSNVRSINQPLPTQTTKFHQYLCQPFVLPQQSCGAPRSVEQPLPTIATAGAISLVEPFLTKYNGTGGAQSVNEPLDTITTKDRFDLVAVDGQKAQIDIRFRMLQPHELARAMSFDDDYVFEGTREQKVKQIGNAVPVNLARALCLELIANG